MHEDQQDIDYIEERLVAGTMERSILSRLEEEYMNANLAIHKLHNQYIQVENRMFMIQTLQVRHCGRFKTYQRTKRQKKA